MYRPVRVMQSFGEIRYFIRNSSPVTRFYLNSGPQNIRVTFHESLNSHCRVQPTRAVQTHSNASVETPPGPRPKPFPGFLPSSRIIHNDSSYPTTTSSTYLQAMQNSLPGSGFLSLCSFRIISSIPHDQNVNPRHERRSGGSHNLLSLRIPIGTLTSVRKSPPFPILILS